MPLVLGRYTAFPFSFLLSLVPLSPLNLTGSLKCIVQSKATVKRAVSFKTQWNMSCRSWALCVAFCDLILRGQKWRAILLFCVCRYNHRAVWWKCSGTPTRTWPSEKDAKRKLFRNVVNLTFLFSLMKVILKCTDYRSRLVYLKTF